MIAIFEEGVGVAVGFADAEDFERYIEHLQTLCEQGERIVTLTTLRQGDQKLQDLVRRCGRRLDSVYKVDEETSEGND